MIASNRSDMLETSLGPATVTVTAPIHGLWYSNNPKSGSGDVDMATLCSQSMAKALPGYCSAIFDDFLCWPPTPPNTTAESSHFCPIKNTIELAFRVCPASGNWSQEKSDYTQCLIAEEKTGLIDGKIAAWLRDIYFTLSIVSLVLLIVTLFIFIYFKSLHCSRISIHKHLVVSFILRFIMIVVMTEPYVTARTHSYRDIPWMCKTFTALSQYLTLATMFWMLVEGFFLHHSLVMGVFSTKAPFKLFYAIGWGLPLLFVVSWWIVLYFTMNEVECWRGYSQKNSFYIISIPFMLAVGINLIFLINIIRVLVSKLRANNRIESANMRKAIKATVVLMPLLGLTNLLFFVNPGTNKDIETAYRVTNAVLTSSQGIFVAILYCFLNGEVRRVIKQKWYRFRLRHGMHNDRRRNSRTSSFFLTSATEVHPLRALKNKMCPDLGQATIMEDLGEFDDKCNDLNGFKATHGQCCDINGTSARSPRIVQSFTFDSEEHGQEHRPCSCTCCWHVENAPTSSCVYCDGVDNRENHDDIVMSP